MSRRILIVDDEPSFRNALKRSFKDSGYELLEAGSVSASKIALDQHPDIGVILLDLSLPDGSGTELLEHIKQSGAENRVVILTAHEEYLAADVARRFDVFTYLPKAARLGQALRFSVSQAFKDIERRQLKDKNRLLNKVQERINFDIQESTASDETGAALRNVLQLVSESVRDLVGAYTSHIRVYDLRKGDFQLSAFAGPNRILRKLFETPKRRPVPFSGLIAVEKQPRNFNDLQGDENFQQWKEESLDRIRRLGDKALLTDAEEYFHVVQSAFLVPITTTLFADEIDAVFNVSADSTDFFTSEKQGIIMEFASQVTAAITKEWQKIRKQESRRDYSGVNSILQAISKEQGGENAKRNIYDIVVKGILEIIRPEAISIYLYNKSTGCLENEAEFSGSLRLDPHNEGHPTDKGLTAHVFSTGKALRLPNFQGADKRKPQSHENVSHELYDDYVKALPSRRINHYLGVPMIVGDEVIGAIQLLNKKSSYYGTEQLDEERWLLERGFGDDDQDVLGIVANQLALAISNANLIEERGRKVVQLETLKDVGRYTSTEMPLEELLKKIIQEVARILKAEICLLFLKDESKTSVRLEQAYGIPKQALSGAHYEIGEGMSGEVARTGRPAMAASGARTGKYDKEIETYLRTASPKQGGIESLMVVPIKAKNELLGVIKVINKYNGERFDHDDLSLLETFGS
jgi:GAF domain-containing protein/AmiR/NasT family two-component response regulator